MKIEAMLHTLKAASVICQSRQLLVIRSQAILGHCQDRDIAFAFDESMEIDLVPIPENARLSDLIDGTIGEESDFHHTYGYYAHGVGMKTALFPAGWENRLKTLELDMGDTPITVFFPSVEDLVLAKYAAGRDKDHRFIQRVAQEQMVNDKLLTQLLQRLPNELSLPARQRIRTLANKDFSLAQDFDLSR